MKIAIGSDHAGFELKQKVLGWIRDLGHEAVDFGTHSCDAVDYPDFAAAVARDVVSGNSERGIVVCGSGAGAAIAANKVRGCRAALAHDTYTAHQCVEHDDANVITFGSRIIGEEIAREVVHAFVAAQFTQEERHVRRLNKVLQLEAENFEESA
jgi:RpiB/LacA/LacB family sugar-phosphate isomerase